MIPPDTAFSVFDDMHVSPAPFPYTGLAPTLDSFQLFPGNKTEVTGCNFKILYNTRKTLIACKI